MGCFILASFFLFSFIFFAGLFFFSFSWYVDTFKNALGVFMASFFFSFSVFSYPVLVLFFYVALFFSYRRAERAGGVFYSG